MPSPSRPLIRIVKDGLRHGAIAFCRTLLRFGSKSFSVSSKPAIIIAPHQDDETLACGGVISHKRDEGFPVHVIFITDGSASHPNHPRFDERAIAEMRHHEAMRALYCLRVEKAAVHFLEQGDGKLHRLTATEGETLVTRLSLLFERISPGEIFLPCCPDGSSEHDAVFSFVMQAIKRSQLKPDIWQYPVWAWWNPQLLLQRWLRSGECRRLPLADHARAKLDAIQCYQTQIAPLAPLTTPALPPPLVKIFQADAEYFFRHQLS